MAVSCGGHPTDYVIKFFLSIPNPVSGRRRNVDGQRSSELLNLHGEQEGCVGHFLHLLFDKLRLRGLLEVFGLGNFVYKAHDLARFMSGHQTAVNKKEENTKADFSSL